MECMALSMEYTASYINTPSGLHEAPARCFKDISFLGQVPASRKGCHNKNGIYAYDVTRQKTQTQTQTQTHTHTCTMEHMHMMSLVGSCVCVYVCVCVCVYVGVWVFV